MMAVVDVEPETLISVVHWIVDTSFSLYEGWTTKKHAAAIFLEAYVRSVGRVERLRP
jgi:hypothetical protein